MIKDILVNLTVRKEESPAEKYALSVAAALEAHIAGVAFVYDLVDQVSLLGDIAVGVVEQQRRDYEGEANGTLDRFAETARRAGISAEQMVLSMDFASVGDRFGRIARRFDLTVVAQAESERDAVRKGIIEGALFDSGRPVIVVPYIQTSPFVLDRLMICWDGSRSAVRAIADAMPLLTLAGRTEVVIVANERDKEDEVEGVDMGQHLARHGLNVEINRISRGEIDVGNALLSHAADTGADLMVMGGYGHSRLREFVLGGVTHSMLRSMTVPVLMSH